MLDTIDGNFSAPFSADDQGVKRGSVLAQALAAIKCEKRHAAGWPFDQHFADHGIFLILQQLLQILYFGFGAFVTHAAFSFCVWKRMKWIIQVRLIPLKIPD